MSNSSENNEQKQIEKPIISIFNKRLSIGSGAHYDDQTNDQSAYNILPSMTSREISSAPFDGL